MENYLECTDMGFHGHDIDDAMLRFHFRIWDRFNGKMSYDSLDSYDFALQTGSNLVYDIMPCIGHRDHRGNLIYENDIILFKNNIKAIVKWYDSDISFILVSAYSDMIIDSYNLEESLVVGNTWEGEHGY